MNEPDKVILHCSATPDSGDYVGAAQIDDWHKDRGWNGIGYHWVIRRSGLVEPGRPEDVQGAHARGHNKNSLGICLVGTSNFTVQQVSSLKVLFKEIRMRHHIDADSWFCHYQFANKACPNIPVNFLREFLNLSL